MKNKNENADKISVIPDGDTAWDPFESMPLELMMLVETRVDALSRYRMLGDDAKERAEARARAAKGRIEKERVIDAIERGEIF
ncbi:MAG: hypothetical protein IJS45_02745 [Clostridia bacterium]|nr:hypothetical protein [Clostridia bacterium]